MNPRTFVISVNMDAKTFSRFAFFDMLHIKKRWKSPALFSLIMVAFAAVAFSRVGVTDGAALLGTVLAAVGLGLPTVYFLSFFLSVRNQIKKMKLDTPKPAYALTFMEEGKDFGAVTPNGNETRYEWEKIYGVFKTDRCLYLYVTLERAYLLPDGDTSGDRAAVLRMAETYGKAR